MIGFNQFQWSWKTGYNHYGNAIGKKRQNFRTTEKAKGFEAFPDQILGKGTYADPQDQALYNEHILSVCHTAVLLAWDKNEIISRLV